MKTFPFLLAALLLGAAPLANAQDDLVTVRLEVGAGNHFLPGALASCDVSVPAGANVGDVLDAAVATGCIDSWTAIEYPGFGRFVDCINDVCSENVLDLNLFGTFWAFYVDDVSASQGIDATFVEAGATYEFTYADWYTSFLLP